MLLIFHRMVSVKRSPNTTTRPTAMVTKSYIHNVQHWPRWNRVPHSVKTCYGPVVKPCSRRLNFSAVPNVPIASAQEGTLSTHEDNFRWEVFRHCWSSVRRRSQWEDQWGGALAFSLLRAWQSFHQTSGVARLQWLVHIMVDFISDRIIFIIVNSMAADGWWYWPILME